MGSRKKDYPDYWTFPQRLCEELAKRKMTRAALADKIGMSRPTVVSWLLSDVPPSLASAAKIADILGVSVDYLCGRTSNPEDLANIEVIVRNKQKEELFQSVHKMKPEDWLFVIRQLELRLQEASERNDG